MLEFCTKKRAFFISVCTKYRKNRKDKRINKMILCLHKKTAKWIFVSISLFNVFSVNKFVLCCFMQLDSCCW